MAVIPFFCTRKGVLSRIDDSFLGFIPSKSQKSVSIPLHHHHADHLCWWAQNTYTRRHTHFFTKKCKAWISKLFLYSPCVLEDIFISFCLVRVLWGGKTFSGPWCQMRKGVKLPIIFKFGFERIIPQTLYYPLSYFLSSSPFDVHLNVYIITGLREQSHHHSIIAVPSFAIRKFHYRCYILCGLENSLSRMSSLYKDEKRCNPGGKIYIRKDEYCITKCNVHHVNDVN